MHWGSRLRQERQRRHLSQETLAEMLGTSSRSIGRWEQGRAFPQGYVRLQLCRLFDLRPEEFFEEPELWTPTKLPWAVPFSRNPCFTGREEVLRVLHDRLTTSQPVALTQASALSGLGGVGKTQVAIEYAYRYASEYQAIFWLAAETPESLMASLQQIANQLQLPERQATEQSQVVAAVQQWLATHVRWLLICDNLEDLNVLQTVLPAVQRGSLLLTTRRQALGLLAEPLELPPMSSEEGVSLMLKRARRLRAFTSDAVPLPGVLPDTSDVLAATELVALLDGLPLALDQAGAYIEETGCSVVDYLQRYRDQRHQVLARRGVHGGDHPASVTTTLSLAVEQIARKHPAAADLLRVCAFLHPEAIPEELFAGGASHLGTALGRVVADPYQFDLLLAALRSASLLTRHPETRTLSIHRLVQAVLQDQMEPGEMRQWSQRVVQMVNTSLPEPDVGTPLRGERYLMQALACLPLIEHTDPACAAGGEVVYKAGKYLMLRGRYKEAKPLLAQAVALAHRQELDHPARISRLLEYGELSWWLGEREAAHHHWQLALTLGEQHLEPTHPLIAEALTNLATLSREQGKDEQAAVLYQRALQHLHEHHSGGESPEMATALNGLALLSWEQGEYEQAETLYQRALRIREANWGPEHPLVGTLLNNLAWLYTEQGEYQQAEHFYQRALRIREASWGPEHPSLAFSLIGLTILSTALGRYEQAERLGQRALRLREQALGTEHADVAIALYHLANLYTEQEKYEQAEPLFQRILDIEKRVFGEEHPNVVFPLHGLATIYTKQGNDEQAELLFQRAIQIGQEMREKKQASVALALHGLATLYHKQGKYAQAEQLYWRALSLQEQTLPQQHIARAQTLHDLALLREAQSNYQEATSLYQRALTIREKALGREHLKTRQTHERLCALLQVLSELRT